MKKYLSIILLLTLLTGSIALDYPIIMYGHGSYMPN
mgnify:CR=1 FL=1